MGINFESRYKDDVICEEAKQTQRDIYIYGCGNIGQHLYDFLNARQLPVKAFLVDDEYYSVSKINNCPVKKLSEVKEDDCAVFVGMSNFKSAQKKLNEININWKTYCISNPCLYLEKNELNKAYYDARKEEFEYAEQLFDDEKSKQLYWAYLNTRINKNAEYLFPFQSGTTYFDKEIIDIGKDEVFVDGGGYNGDTLKSFLSVAKAYKKIYVIEPSTEHCREIETLIKEENLKNVVIKKVGLWCEPGERYIENFGEQETTIVDYKTENVLKVDSLDNMFLTDERITLIKLSIQGSEKEALLGAKEILKVHEPNLAINIFAKPEAIMELPRIIKEINPRYKLYLRCENPFFVKVILYGRVMK